MAGELITQDWQIDWDGFLLGPGTLYDLVRLDGWIDSPSLSNGAAARPSRHGSWPGRMRAEARTVTATLEVVAATSGMADAIHALRDATRITPDATTAPLAIRCSGETLVAFGKFAGRVVSVDQPYSMGIAPAATLQWWCADPRLFEINQQTATIAAPTSGTGLNYPLAYPLTYGTTSTPSNATCVNNGNEATNPTLVFTGPITTPRLVNSTLNRALEFDLELGIGQTLTVDTDRGTVLLNGATDRLYTRTAFSVPVEYFELAPGANDLNLAAASFGVGSQVQIAWRSAYL